MLFVTFQMELGWAADPSRPSITVVRNDVITAAVPHNLQAVRGIEQQLEMTADRHLHPDLFALRMLRLVLLSWIRL